MSLAMVPVLTLLLLAVLFAGSARALPDVFFAPGSTTLQLGESVELSFRVGACGDSISGYQLYLSFDPTIVELTTATEGSLYAYCGYPTWFIPEEEAPGQWHFFDTVMGAGTYLLPPGELLRLEFTALDRSGRGRRHCATRTGVSQPVRVRHRSAVLRSDGRKRCTSRDPRCPRQAGQADPGPERRAPG
jgi:hypothetical protein